MKAAEWKAKAEQAERDIRILLAIIDGLESATGEGPEGDDRVMVEQIRGDYPTAPTSGAPDNG